MLKALSNLTVGALIIAWFGASKELIGGGNCCGSNDVKFNKHGTIGYDKSDAQCPYK